eukprot:tig00001471_g8867.t1
MFLEVQGWHHRSVLGRLARAATLVVLAVALSLRAPCAAYGSQLATVPRSAPAAEPLQEAAPRVQDTHGALRLNAEETPNPARQWRACKRPRRSCVCNADGVLSEDAAERLEAIARQLEQERGHQIGYAVVRAIGASGERATAEEAARAARRLHDRWGVGHAGKGDGVLVLFSAEDRRVHISTGAAVRRELSDQQCAWIVESARPLLRAGDHGAALVHIAEGIQRRLCPSSAGAQRGSRSGPLVVAAAVTALLASRYAGARRKGREQEARAALRELRRLRGEPGHTGALCALCFEAAGRHSDGLLPCGHNFHPRCLAQGGHSAACPVCGAPTAPGAPAAARWVPLTGAHGLPRGAARRAAAAVATDEYLRAAARRLGRRYAAVLPAPGEPSAWEEAVTRYVLAEARDADEEEAAFGAWRWARGRRRRRGFYQWMAPHSYTYNPRRWGGSPSPSPSPDESKRSSSSGWSDFGGFGGGSSSGGGGGGGDW